MISREQVHELIRLRTGAFPVTTLFLRLDGGRDGRKAEILIKDLIKRERSSLEGRGLTRVQLRSVEQDFERVLRYVHNFDRKGSRGIAVFSSSGAGLWRHHALAQPVADRLVVDTHPHVRPLSRLLDRSRPCLVVRIARDHATLDLVHLGEIRRLEAATGDVPQEMRAGGFAGTAERRIERHAEDRLQRFAKLLAGRAAAQSKAHAAEVVVLGGPPEMVAAFESHVPRSFLERVVVRLDLSPEAPAANVLGRTTELLARHAQERGIRAADAAIHGAAAGGLGAAGIGPTLRALAAGKAAVVVVSAGLCRPGLACTRCPALAAAGEQCLRCGEAMVPVPDVVEELIDRTLGHGVEVVEVEEHAELEAAGGMAVLLRYGGNGTAARAGRVAGAGSEPGWSP